MCVCTCMYTYVQVNVGALGGQEEGGGSPGVGVISGCEFPDEGAVCQTQVLCRSICASNC